MTTHVSRKWAWALPAATLALSACSADSGAPAESTRQQALDQIDIPPDATHPWVPRTAPPLTDREIAYARSLLQSRPKRLATFDTSRMDPTVVPTADGNYQIDVPEVPSGATHLVTTLGPSFGVRSIIHGAERRAMPANDRAFIELAVAAGAVGLGIRVPRDLDSLSAVELAALKDLILRTAPAKPSPRPDLDLKPSALTTCLAEKGVGLLSDTEQCAASYILKDNWFPLRSAMNCIRNQANRGTCTSFGITGATEIAYKVKHTKRINLSEQGLYARAMDAWYGVDYGDGLDIGLALDGMIDEHYQFPWESTWDYNRSLQRQIVSPYYVLSCLAYPEKCSDTTHQLPYSYSEEHFVDLTAGSSLISLSNYFAVDPENDLPIAKFLLTASIPLVLGLDATTQFKSPYQGREILMNPFDTFIGGHTVLVVGFVDDASLPPFMSPHSESGGGFFIVRNSWGCGWGDGGYVYLPYSYAAAFGDSMYGIGVE